MLTTMMIGNKIAEARKKMNISQAQLAQRLFISAQAVGKWERGESIPDIITFNRLATILGVDLNYFSENFESTVAETKTAESSENQSVELPSGKQKKKLSWDMSRGNWVDADFSGLKNLHEKFSSSNMQRCQFIGSDLARLLLKNNNVDGCDFSNSDISSSNFQNSNIGNNVFKDCSMKETEFSGCNIGGCDFAQTDFSDATMKWCNLQKNNMANAIWNRTSFTGMHFDDIVFDGSMHDCHFENCSFAKVTFQKATITNTFFKGKSLKRIKFIECKVDGLTYAFLKNGKADLSGVELLIN